MPQICKIRLNNGNKSKSIHEEVQFKFNGCYLPLSAESAVFLFIKCKYFNIKIVTVSISGSIRTQIKVDWERDAEGNVCTKRQEIT
jgi:hypothetical protein